MLYRQEPEEGGGTSTRRSPGANPVGDGTGGHGRIGAPIGEPGVPAVTETCAVCTSFLGLALGVAAAGDGTGGPAWREKPRTGADCH